MRQSAEDLQAHLAGQLRSLERECAAFDGGDDYASSRIAGIIRILLHDSSRSRSLLGQLGMLDRSFYDGSPDLPQRPGRQRFLPGLCLFGSPEKGYVPIFKIVTAERRRAFKPWWTDPVRILGNQEYSRCQLVMAVANKDGGAHIDLETSEWYASLKTGEGVPITFSSWGEEAKPLTGLIPNSIRQIAHEVTLSVQV